VTNPADKAQALLARYKAAGALPPEHKARLLDVVSERVAHGDLPRFDVPAPAPVVPEPTLLAQLWASPWVKAALGLAALGVPAAGLYGLSDRAPTAAPSATASVPGVVVSPQVPSVVDESPASALQPPAKAPDPRDEVRAERTAPPPSAGEPTIDEEVRLMNAAQKALQGSQPQRALELLSEHATRFPRGKLASARQVTRMMALCQAGQTDKARHEAKQFVAQNPSSPFVDRVKTICASDPKER
jgi:hypothetical protein